MMSKSGKVLRGVALVDLVAVRELQPRIANIFPTHGSLDWELRVNRRAYIEAGALFEIAGRLLAHPAVFARVALSIGARKVAGAWPADK